MVFGFDFFLWSVFGFWCRTHTVVAKNLHDQDYFCIEQDPVT